MTGSCSVTSGCSTDRSLLLVLRSLALHLRSNTALLRTSMSTLLTTVHQVSILLGDAGRIVYHLRAHLLCRLLEVGLLVGLRSDGGWDVVTGATGSGVVRRGALVLGG